MVREYCRVSEREGDDFVGLRYVEQQPVVVFPRGFSISDNEKTLRRDVLRLLATIGKFSGHQEGERVRNLAGETNLSFPYLSYQYVIYDYLAHGYYTESEVKYSEQQRGKINWKRTIQQKTPQIDENNVVYLSFVVKQSQTNHNSLLTKIHEFCVYQSFSKLGWLYTDSEILPPKPSIRLNKRLFISTLKQALSSTFNEQKRLLFQSMINIIVESDEQADDRRSYAFGVERFDHVWEGLVDYVFGDDDKERYYPRANWHIVQGRGGVFPSSELRPDTVVKVIDKVFILDAKYYKYGVTLNPMHLPATDSIQKQITYGEYVEREGLAQRNKIFNAFIMPFNSRTGEPFKFVTVGTAEWKEYGPETANHEYVLGLLVDTTYLLRTYSRHNLAEIDKLTTLIEDSLESYRIQCGQSREQIQGGVT